MPDAPNLLTPVFKVHTSANETASKAAGRPIFTELEVVEIRFAGDRQKVAVFPAHDAEPNATRLAIASGEITSSEVITYAQVYSAQYRQFKAATTQSVTGTPIEELPFIGAAKRSELKALNIHTAEALAALDGTPLKQLGIGGRELKTQATVYLANAAGSADITALAAQVAALQQQIRDRDDLIDHYASRPAKTRYQRGVERSVAEQAAAEADARAEAEAEADDEGEVADEAEAEPQGKSLEECTDAELRAYIKDQTGEAVRGNPGRDKLIERAMALATAPDDKAA